MADELRGATLGVDVELVARVHVEHLAAVGAGLQKDGITYVDTLIYEIRVRTLNFSLEPPPPPLTHTSNDRVSSTQLSYMT